MLRIRRRQLRTRVDPAVRDGAQAQRQIVNRIGRRSLLHPEQAGCAASHRSRRTTFPADSSLAQSRNHCAIAAVHHLDVTAQRLLDALAAPRLPRTSRLTEAEITSICRLCL